MASVVALRASGLGLKTRDVCYKITDWICESFGFWGWHAEGRLAKDI